MIAIFGPRGNSLAVDRRRLLQFTTAIFVSSGYQVGVLVRIAGGNIERGFSIFADVPYHDRLSRQQWEQLWRAEPQ
jgi:hypothetical protein